MPKGIPGHPVCLIEGCDAANKTGGLCNKHEHRLRRRGSTEVGPKCKDEPEVRVWAYVAKRDAQHGGCWGWTGGTVNGYGRFQVASRRHPAHRFIYELLRGPIPEGLVLDHLCRNTRCVNPDHLEPVTNRENILRGVSPAAVAARRTHCANGHLYDDANTYWYGATRRMCRKCHATRQRIRRQPKENTR